MTYGSREERPRADAEWQERQGKVMGRAGLSAHAFAGGALAVVLAGLVALVTHQAWLFPSLGPAVMLHVEKPDAPESSPRNTLIGHAVALAGRLRAAGGLRSCATTRRCCRRGSASRASWRRPARWPSPHRWCCSSEGIAPARRCDDPHREPRTCCTPRPSCSSRLASVMLVTVIDWLFNRVTGQAMPVWSARAAAGSGGTSWLTGSPTRGASARRTGRARRGRCGSTCSSTAAVTEADVDRLGAVGVGAALQRRRDGHRRRATAASSACAAGPCDRVNRGRLGPEGPVRLAGQPQPGPADPPAGPRRRPAGRDRLGHRDGPHRRRGRASCWTGPGGWGHFGFYTTGQLFLEEYYTLGVIGKAGHRHPAHGRQHPAVHGHRGGGAEGQLRHRRAARLVHRRRPLRRDRAVGPQRRRDADGAVDADARPPPRPEPAGDAGRRPARDPGRARGRRAPGGAHRHQPGADERPAARDHPARLVRRASTSRAHTIGFDELCRDRRRATRRERVAEICDVPAADVERAAELLGTSQRLLSTVLQGFYQSNQATAAACQVNNLHLRPRHDRPAGRRGLPDERPAHRAEHPRDRRRRRPARPAQLGQPGAHPRAGRAVERRRRRRSRTGRRRPTRCRSSATPSRARSSCCGSRATNPAVSLPDLARIRRILARAGAVRRRAGPLPDRDRRARRRGAARRDLGREDRHVHQRRPHRAPLRARPSTRPARPAPTWTSSSTTPAGWTSATGTATR